MESQVHRTHHAAAKARRQKTEPTHWQQSVRDVARDLALQSAIMKRERGAPSYNVPEAAALLSISPDYLYRLIRAGAFPHVCMQTGTKQGRYVVSAEFVEQLLDGASQLPTGGMPVVGNDASPGVSGGVR